MIYFDTKVFNKDKYTIYLGERDNLLKRECQKNDFYVTSGAKLDSCMLAIENGLDPIITRLTIMCMEFIFHKTTKLKVHYLRDAYLVDNNDGGLDVIMRFSKTNKCVYFPYDMKVHMQIYEEFKNQDLRTDLFFSAEKSKPIYNKVYEIAENFLKEC